MNYKQSNKIKYYKQSTKLKLVKIIIIQAFILQNVALFFSKLTMKMVPIYNNVSWHMCHKHGQKNQSTTLFLK